MRSIKDEAAQQNATIVAVGTGDRRYAEDFVKTEGIDFMVLLDENAQAAQAASLKTATALKLLSPSSLVGSFKAFRDGHRQKKLGKRPMQLGATFVIKPPGKLVYEHLDGSVEDHAPLSEVLAAIA